jgi:hypothetical protein
MLKNPNKSILQYMGEKATERSSIQKVFSYAKQTSKTNVKPVTLTTLRVTKEN